MNKCQTEISVSLFNRSVLNIKCFQVSLFIQQMHNNIALKESYNLH